MFPILLIFLKYLSIIPGDGFLTYYLKLYILLLRLDLFFWSSILYDNYLLLIAGEKVRVLAVDGF